MTSEPSQTVHIASGLLSRRTMRDGKELSLLMRDGTYIACIGNVEIPLSQRGGDLLSILMKEDRLFSKKEIMRKLAAEELSEKTFDKEMSALRLARNSAIGDYIVRSNRPAFYKLAFLQGQERIAKVTRIRGPYERQANDRISVLSAFSADLAQHPEDLTRVVDYETWHDSSDNWSSGKGVLLSVTFGELPHVWSDPNLFSSYEAMLLRFMRRGGEIRRVFVLGRHEIEDHATQMTLQRILYRHEALGMPARIARVPDLDKTTGQVGVNADTYAALNGKSVLLMQSHVHGRPTLVWTADETVVRKCSNAVYELWNTTESATGYLSRVKTKVTAEDVLTTRRDIEVIEELAFEKPGTRIAS